MFSHDADVGVKCMWKRVFFKPCLHVRMLVRGVVVADQVQCLALGRFAIDLAQKAQPLGVAMALLARISRVSLDNSYGPPEIAAILWLCRV
jgi:hypothetical protein